MRSFENENAMERAPELRRRLRRTAWIIAAVIATLGVGAACFIAKNGWKSRTVLHSRFEEGMLREGVISWT
jgi:hypothetical protein